MKKVIFTKIALICAMFFCSSFVAFADTQFQMPSPPKASALVSSETDTVYMYNVGVAQFLNAGNMWGTQAVVAKKGLPIKAIQDENGEWSFYFYEGSQYEQLLFRSDEEGVYVDFDWNGESQWSLTSVGNNTYRIQSSMYGDWGFGEYDVENNWFLGQDPDREDYYTDDHEETWGIGVWGNVTPSASTNVDWQFIKKSDYLYYEAKITLLDLMIAAEERDLEIDDALAVYNNQSATLPELNAAIESLESELGDYEFQAIVSRADVPISFKNDATHPWTVEGNTAIIRGTNKSNYYAASWLTMTFRSEKQTELSFEWARYNYSYHEAMQVFIDGIYKGSTTNSSYTSQRFYLDAGEHVVAFRDSVSYRNYTDNWSGIRNIKVKEILPLETAVLTENSQPLTFTNDGTWPWTIEDGYVQNSNYGTANSSSKFSTSFKIDVPSKFSFERQVTPYNDFWRDNTWTSYQYLYTKINGETYMTDWNNSNWDICSVMLEPGDYTIEWLETLANTTSAYYSRIRNIELSSNWVDVDLSSAGSLGVEVLYLVDVLTDVELLKVKGPINSTDWATIKQMTNLLALDLSEAQFEAIPNNAFDGLSRLSNVKLPEGLKTIGEYAFRGTQIWNITIPSTVTSIGQYAFASTRLKAVNFAEGSQLQSIAQYAFNSCTSLNEFIMPSTVSSVGQYAFRSCTALQKLSFSDLITTINRYTCAECNQLTDLHLPSNLETIWNNAFYNNYNLRHIDLPSSLNNICYNAFYNCAIDSVKLPVTLTYLGEYAFQNCYNLKYIELPSYLENTSIYNNSTYYYGYRYNFYNCDAIETIVMRSATPPSIIYDPFQDSRAKSAITLKVPSFAVVNYKLDSYWYQFGSIVEGDDIDYWKITSPLSLTNNRRMQGKPDIDLYYGGQFTVGGNAPMEIGQFNIYVHESNPGRLLNTCEAMTADDINTYYSVNSETWYFFTPLHDVNLANVKVSNDASYVFRYYDGDSRATNGTGNSWRNVDNGKLLAGQGYIFRCNTDAVLTMPAGLGLTFIPLAPMANEEAWEAKVCYTTQSNSDWAQTTFDDSSWETQQAAWGTTDSYSNVRSDWSVENSDIYVRRTVNLTANDLQKDLWLRFTNDDDFELFINGKPVFFTGYTGVLFDRHRLSISDKDNLHVGENIIAAHCHNHGGPGFIDFGLYEKSFEGGASGYDRVLSTTDITQSLSAYEAAASANKSWNFVGNPYPCYYDIYYMDFTAPITVWTGSTYKAYSIVDDNYALRPMQAFFVQKPDAVDNIVFHKEGRQLTTDINHAAGVKEFAPANQSRYFFELQMIGEELADETRIVINEEASLDHEIERDASKFMSFESAVPQIFTLDGEGNGYAINERPLADGIVKLAYYAGQSDYYTITANRADGDIYLYDAKTNKTVNLNEQDYTFHSDATNGTNTTRFTLSLNVTDATDIKDIEHSPLSSEHSSVYDLQGRKTTATQKGIYIKDGRKVMIK